MFSKCHSYILHLFQKDCVLFYFLKTNDYLYKFISVYFYFMFSVFYFVHSFTQIVATNLELRTSLGSKNTGGFTIIPLLFGAWTASSSSSTLLQALTASKIGCKCQDQGPVFSGCQKKQQGLQLKITGKEENTWNSPGKHCCLRKNITYYQQQK